MSRSSARGGNFVVILEAIDPVIEIDRAATDAARDSSSECSRATLFVAWLVALLILLFALGTPQVRRTQEARVMETARETLERQGLEGIRAWLVPVCNGQVRLQKPPLAYWLSAVSFAIFGVNEWSGRLPMMLAGWITLGLAMSLAARCFGRSASLWTGAILLGSLLFVRNSRLAETDVLVTLFITLGIVAIIRGLGAPRPTAWYALSGLAIGAILLSKHATAIFPLLFLLAIVAIERNWKALWHWTRSGAPLIAIVVGVPWWAYVFARFGADVFGDEAETLFEGRNHPGSFWVYGPMLLKATLPWCGFGVAAMVTLARWCRHRHYAAHVRLLVWVGVILVPLCFIGNKQEHYLLPVMPPLAMLTAAWLADDRRSARVARPMFMVTFVLTAIVLLSIPLIARRVRAEVMTVDLALGAIGAVGAVAILLLWRRRGWRAAVAGYAVLTALLMGPLVNVWWPTIRRADPRGVAARLRTVAPDGPYCFYGENFSLPLVFAMRTVMPHAPDDAALLRLAKEHPRLVVIAQTKSDRDPPPLPAGFTRLDEIRTDDQKFELYTAR